MRNLFIFETINCRNTRQERQQRNGQPLIRHEICAFAVYTCITFI
jgi:hypothetical protein